MSRSVYLVPCLLLIWAGCGDDPSGPVIPADYFPMEVGDWWEYDQKATRIQPDTMVWQEGTERFEVTAVNGDSCTVSRSLSLWILHGELLEDTLLLSNEIRYVVTDNEVIMILSDSLSPEKILDFPLETGKTWGPYTVTEMGATVQTPAGAMEDCAVIGSVSAEFGYTTQEWYCPGIGAVRRYSPDYNVVSGFILEVDSALRSSSRL